MCGTTVCIAALAFVASETAWVRTVPSDQTCSATDVPRFIENRGLVNDRVRFILRQQALAVALTDDGFECTLSVVREDDATTCEQTDPASVWRPLDARHREQVSVRFAFEGASPDVRVVGIGELGGRVHDIHGSDPSRWSTDARSFERVSYRGLYPDVDLDVYAKHGHIEYDLSLAPSASLATCVIRCDGADSLALDADGALVIATPLGELRQTAPATYRVSADGKRTMVASGFVLLDASRFGFVVANEDCRTDALVIDPGIVYSTFLGGAGADVGYSIAIDDQGAVYVAGETASLDFPDTFGAHTGAAVPAGSRGLVAPHTDVFVAKLDLARDHTPELVWVTTLGGSADDRATAIAVDAAGGVYVVGLTYSDDFPTTAHAYAATKAGAYDAFVTKLKPDGSGLDYSTYLGGAGGDYALSVTVSPAQEAFVTGGTDSVDFPVTPGCFDSISGGDVDMFVAKFDAGGDQLSYSTFIGSMGYEDGAGIVVDRHGEAYVTGRSSSPDFPTTPGAYQSTGHGSFDTVVLKLSADGGSLVYSTLVAADRRDEGHAIAVDQLGHAHVVGVARSELFPVTPGAFDTTHNGGYDVTVFELNAAGSRLEYSTFLGGTLHDVGWDIAVDAERNTYVTGFCYSPEFPVTIGSMSPEFNGYCDGFLTVLDSSGSSLLYSTFIGKHKLDEGVSLALSETPPEPPLASNQANLTSDVNRGVRVFLTGYTYSTFFPTTADAYDRTWNGDFDAFVSVLDPHASCPASSRSYGQGWPGTDDVTPSLNALTPPTVCTPFTVTITDAVSPSHGAIVVGFAPAEIPTSLGGTLLVTFDRVMSVAVPSNRVELSIQVCDEVFCGLELYLQVMILDFGASQMVSFTNGLRLDLGSF